jgi:hypothetical protein
MYRAPGQSSGNDQPWRESGLFCFVSLNDVIASFILSYGSAFQQNLHNRCVPGIREACEFVTTCHRSEQEELSFQQTLIRDTHRCLESVGCRGQISTNLVRNPFADVTQQLRCAERLVWLRIIDV